MDPFDVKGTLSVPTIRNPGEPRREIDLSSNDEALVEDAIERLDQSTLDTEKLFTVFEDWQTKKTLTSKRVFVSTSILVSAATWIGIDYNELTLFGLRVSDAESGRFLLFILGTIVLSGIFYEFSRRIDLSVRKARINQINLDLKDLVKPFQSLQKVMENNRIDSFVDLYFDFRSALTTSSQHDAIDVFRAIRFYRENLTKAGIGLRVVMIGEQIIIYSVAIYAIVALIQASIS